MTNEQKYKEALERIAKLADCTQVRATDDNLLDTGWEDKYVTIDPDGSRWIPIDFRIKMGLNKAASIAKEALK